MLWGWMTTVYSRASQCTNGVAPALLLMFALQSWMQTFPLVAYTGWLYHDLDLSLAEGNQYESLA